MSRLVQQEISQMTLDHRQAPHSWICQGRRWRVERALESWKDAGMWWEGELEKTFWRVIVAGGGIVELWQDSSGAWQLYRVWD